MNNLIRTTVVLLLLWGICTAYYIYKSNTYVTAEFKELAPFNTSAPIYYNGFKIGKVIRVRPNKTYTSTIVTMELHPHDLKLPINISANLKKAKNRWNKKYDYIDITDPKTPSVYYLKDGDRISGKTTVELETFLSNQDPESLEAIKKDLAESAKNAGVFAKKHLHLERFSAIMSRRCAKTATLPHHTPGGGAFSCPSGWKRSALWRSKTKGEHTMAVVSMKQLLEAGVHFGHQTRRWNPKMAPYIYTERNGIYIIDLQKTVKKLEEAYNFVRELAANGQSILFVGTKKQAQDAIKEEAERVGQYYVNARWLGGMLTNFRTMRTRIDRLAQLKKMEADGTFAMLPKKEVIKHQGEIAKLEKYLGGVKEMKKLPGALFIVDPRKERNAIAEARKLHIPIVAIVDTNCDPDEVDYVIPGNDDAIRAIRLIASTMANAVTEGRQGEENTEAPAAEAEAPAAAE